MTKPQENILLVTVWMTHAMVFILLQQPKFGCETAFTHAIMYHSSNMLTHEHTDACAKKHTYIRIRETTIVWEHTYSPK